MRKNILFLFLTTCFFISQQAYGLNPLYNTVEGVGSGVGSIVGGVTGGVTDGVYDGGDGIVDSEEGGVATGRCNAQPAECCPTICYRPYVYYTPQYYCTRRCEEYPTYYQKRHCRMVPQYYEKTCCRYVPQYYKTQHCRYVPQYYCTTECRMCKKYCLDRHCRYIPHYFYKKECEQPQCCPAEPQGCCQ